MANDSTTIKVSTATRDRLKSFGGDTYEDTVIAALDALDAQSFWDEAERGRRSFEALPAAERERVLEDYRRIDREFGGL